MEFYKKAIKTLKLLLKALDKAFGNNTTRNYEIETLNYNFAEVINLPLPFYKVFKPP